MISEEDYQDMLARTQGFGSALQKALATTKPKRRKVTSEAEIERDCTQILIHDGWRPLKTDPVSNRGRGKGFGELGMADYEYIRYRPICRTHGANRCDLICGAQNVELIWIEWKREDGTAAEHQIEWHERERAKGALTLIAGIDFTASVEGFAEWYGKSGLRRNHA